MACVKKSLFDISVGQQQIDKNHLDTCRQMLNNFAEELKTKDRKIEELERSLSNATKYIERMETKLIDTQDELSTLKTLSKI